MRKIKVKYIKSINKINVKRVGVLEGVATTFITSLGLAMIIDRAALRGRRIFQVGSVDEFDGREK